MRLAKFVKSACGQIQAWVRPPHHHPSRQCLYFGNFWSGIPSLNLLTLDQLALVNLKKLREVQLLPTTLETHDQERATNSRLAVFVDFDRVLMRRLDQLGCLGNLTRLEVLVDKHCYLEEHMPHLTHLIQLSLTVTSLRAIR